MSHSDERSRSGAVPRPGGRSDGRTMEDILGSIRRLMAEEPESAPTSVRLDSARGAPRPADTPSTDFGADVLDLTLVADVGDELDLDDLASAMLDAVREKRSTRSVVAPGAVGEDRRRDEPPVDAPRAEAVEAGPPVGDDSWVELEDLLSVAEETFGAPGAAPQEPPPALAAAPTVEDPAATLVPAPRPLARRPSGEGFDLPHVFREPESGSEEAREDEAVLEAPGGVIAQGGRQDLLSEVDAIFGETEARDAGVPEPVSDDAPSVTVDAVAEAAGEDAADRDAADQDGTDAVAEAVPADLEAAAAADDDDEAAEGPAWPGDDLEASASVLESALGDGAEIEAPDVDAESDVEASAENDRDGGARSETEGDGDTGGEEPVAQEPFAQEPVAQEPVAQEPPAPESPRSPAPVRAPFEHDLDPRNGPSNDDLRRLAALRKKLEKMAAERLGHGQHERRRPDPAVLDRVGDYDPTVRAPAEPLPVRPLPELDAPAAAPVEADRPTADASEAPAPVSEESARLQKARAILESGETPRDLDVTPGVGPGGAERTALRGMVESVLRESLESVLEEMLSKRAKASRDENGPA